MEERMKKIKGQKEHNGVVQTFGATGVNNAVAIAFEKAEAEKQDKSPADPFAVVELEAVDAKAEDLMAAKARAETQAAEQAVTAEKVGNFATSIFPVMAGLVERRETSRGLSQKNFTLYDGQVAAYIGRPAPAGAIAMTAYVMAVVRAQGGVVDPEVMVVDLISRRLVKEDPAGSISRGKKCYSLGFAPMEEHRTALIQAVRERFGEAERVAREEYGRKVKALLASGVLTVWQLFSGIKGAFAFYRPFEKAAGTGKDGPWTRVFKPGVIAGESDGQRISFTAGLGGCENIVATCHEEGLTLAITALGDPDFFTRKDELKPLIPVHRTLWSIRRHLEAQGQGPTAEADVAELGKVEGLVSPTNFFASEMPAETLVIFDEVYENGNPKPWKAWDQDGFLREGDKRYNPLYNVAGVLIRDKGGIVSWKATPAHLGAYFSGAVGKALEGKGNKPEVHGLPLALYRWAKNKYATKAVAAEVAPPSDK